MKRMSLFVRKDREGLHLPTRDMGLLRAVDYRFFYFLPCTDLSFLIFSTMTMHLFYKKKVIFNIQKDDRNKYRDSTIMSKKKKRKKKLHRKK